jgi:hypothetical protein
MRTVGQTRNAQKEDEMKPTKIQMLCVLAFMALFSLTTSAQEVLKEKAYQLRLQPGWTRTQDLPQGIDGGLVTSGGSAA